MATCKVFVYTTDPLKRPNGLYVGEIHERASERRGGSLDPANRAQSGGGVPPSWDKSAQGVWDAFWVREGKFSRARVPARAHIDTS